MIIIISYPLILLNVDNANYIINKISFFFELYSQKKHIGNNIADGAE